ncbi:MAG: hypothetical protein ACREO3_03655 [Arenimonas sp.]
MNANLQARLLAEFVGSAVVLVGLLFLTLPLLNDWGAAACPSNASPACTVANTILGYWPFVALLLFFAIFYALHKAYSILWPTANNKNPSPAWVTSKFRFGWQIALLAILVIANLIWIMT